MKVTAAIVTKNRPEFLPWLAWNIRKQTRQPDELIVVDSTVDVRCAGSHVERTEAKDQYAVAVDEFLRECGASIKYFHYYNVSPESTTGDSRNGALELVDPDHILMWFDDDDWHHPRRIEMMAEAIESERCKVVYVSNTHRLILDEMTLVNIGESFGDISLPFCALPARIAKRHRFPSTYTAEDVHWLREIVAECRGLIYFHQEWDIPTIALIHGSNTWNRPDLPEYDLYKERTDCSFPKYGPLDVGQEQWDETIAQLEALRERLGMG